MTSEMNDKSDWPHRPIGERFPPVLDSLLVGQLLLHDRQGMTPDQSRRNVRLLVKRKGLPTMKRVGRGLLFDLQTVIGWLSDVDADAVSAL